MRQEDECWEFLFLWQFFSPLHHEGHSFSFWTCSFSLRRMKKSVKIGKNNEQVRVFLSLMLFLHYWPNPWDSLSFLDFFSCCMCVLFDLIFIRALNIPLLSSAIFHLAYSHCFLTKHILMFIKWPSWLFSFGPKLLYSFWKSCFSSVIFTYYLQLELFRKYPCTVMWVFLIFFLKSRKKWPSVQHSIDFIISIHMHHCICITNSWDASYVLPAPIASPLLWSLSQSIPQICFKDRGPETTKEVPQVISLDSWKAEIQTEICTTLKARIFLYVKLLSQDLFSLLL